MKVSKLIPNPSNPRLIKDDKFMKLVTSIETFDIMLSIRPIIIDETFTILGGNMRYKAIQHLKMKDIPDEWVRRITGLTDEQKKEFIIKDNVGFGEWDWNDLANNWDETKLNEWGLELNNFQTSDIDLDSFFEEDNSEKENKNKIVLEYTDEEFELVNEALKNHTGSKEQIFFKLLGL